LDKYHIQRRAAENRQEIISLPDMQQHNGKGGDKLRQPPVAGQKVNIPKAVDHQHSDNGRRQDLAHINNCLWAHRGQTAQTARLL